MSVYPPPNFEEYLSVFNPANWGAETTTGLDIAYLDANYLKFPIAQGTENLLKTNVIGDLTINNTNNKILLNNPSTNVLITDNSNPLVTSSANLNANNIIISGDTASGAILSNCGSNCNNNIIIGGNNLTSTLPSATTVSDNTIVGTGILPSLESVGQSSQNTAVGKGCLPSVLGGERNCAFGCNSGLNLEDGAGNIFLGANTGIDVGLGGFCNGSVVIGTNALANASNQLYIGGDCNTVHLAPQRPIYFEGTSSNLSSGINYQTIDLGINTSYNWTKTGINSFITFIASSNYTVFLDDNLDSCYYQQPFWLSNASKNTMTITSPANLLFEGKYGVSSSSFPLNAGGVVGIYLDSATNAWIVFSKVSQSSVITANSVTINNLNYLLDSVVRLSPTANQTITIPTLSANSNCFGQSITFANQGGFTSTLTCGTSFTGLYGTRTTSLIIYPYTTVVIQANPSSLTYNVNNRALPTITVNYTYTGSAITLTYNEVDSVVNLTGSTATTVNLPNPTTGSNTFIAGRSYRVFNNGSGVITLSTPSGTFGGIYGNSSATITLPDNVWYNVVSDGTNWIINERSSNITYTNSLTANANYANNANYTDATLRLNSNGAYTVTYPSPVTATSHTTTSKIYNLSDFTLTISIGAGTFSGKYGSGTTTITIPPNNYIELFSDGANWFVQDRSNDFSFSAFAPSVTNLTSNQYFDSTYTILPPEASGSGATALAGTFTQSGQTLTVVTNTGGNISAGSYLTVGTQTTVVLSQISGTSGTTGNYYVTCSQTVAVATAFSGFQGHSILTTGTLSQIGFATNTQTNFQIASLVTIAGGLLNVGTSYWNNLLIGPNAYTLSYATTGSNFRTTGACTSSTGTTAFYATEGRTINLPIPSASNKGRKITLVNDSHLPINITTVGGGVSFGGQFGQQSYTGTLNVANSYFQSTKPNNYLLFPYKTVVLQSNGSSYDAIIGTTIGGTKTYVNNSAVTTSTTDGTNTISSLTPYTLYSQDVFGINLYTDGTSGNGSARIYNNTGYPVTLSVSANCVWNAPTLTSGTSPTSNRRLYLTYYNNGGGTSHPISYSLSSCITTSLVTSTFSYSATPPTNNLSTIITLLPFDSIGFTVNKYNGSGATTETVGINQLVIDVARIA